MAEIPQTPEQIADWLNHQQALIEQSYPENPAYPWPTLTSFGKISPILENPILREAWPPATRRLTMQAYLNHPESERAAKRRWLYLVKIAQGGKVWVPVGRAEVDATTPALVFANAILRFAGSDQGSPDVVEQLNRAGNQLAALVPDLHQQVAALQSLANLAPACFNSLINQAWDGIGEWRG